MAKVTGMYNNNNDKAYTNLQAKNNGSPIQGGPIPR